MNLEDRARLYVAKMPAAIAGQGGHHATFHVACVLLKGFDLSPDVAREIMEEFNGRCEPRWSAKELDHKIRSADQAADDKPRGYLVGDRTADPFAAWNVDVAPKPTRARGPKIPGVDRGAVNRLLETGPNLRRGDDWVRFLAERSRIGRQRVNPAELSTADVLEAIFRTGERILIFVNEFTQGDYLYEVGRGGFRLADTPKVRAVPSDLPRGGPRGVWYLTNPVCGTWQAPRRAMPGKASTARLGRRHSGCLTDWRFLILESDTIGWRDWLAIIVQLPLPIVALYSSGGKSIHALVELGTTTKETFDTVRDWCLVRFCPLGADGRAMTGVRLSRLPQAERGTRQQRLLFINPGARWEAIQAIN